MLVSSWNDIEVDIEVYMASHCLFVFYACWLVLYRNSTCLILLQSIRMHNKHAQPIFHCSVPFSFENLQMAVNQFIFIWSERAFF